MNSEVILNAEKGEMEKGFENADLSGAIIGAAIEPIHFTIVRSYLEALNLRTALVLNLATTPLTIRRGGLE